MSELFAAKISGIGSYLPEKVMTNDDLAKIVETNHQWIYERTGIASRHVAAPDQATSDLSVEAAKRAMEMAGITAQDIDAIFLATVTPDHIMPATACLVQHKLGCRNVMAFDLSAACTGFLYGLTLADQCIRGGLFKNILVIGAETLSRILNYQDRGTCILFGDGAGAAIVSRTKADDPSRIISSHMASQGEFSHFLFIEAGGSRTPINQKVLDDNLHHMTMLGKDIFKTAVPTMRDRAREAMQANQLSPDQIDWFLFHQANTRINEKVAEYLDLDLKKVPMNIETTGNTSAGSIPILMDQQVRAGKIKRGDLILASAFGAGLTSGSVLFRF